jgi:hypothetical protein
MAIKLKIVEGTDEPITLYLKKSGNVLDLTGASARLVIRRSLFGPVLKGIDATVTGNEGKLVFPLVPADTDGWLTEQKEEDYVFGISLTDAAGKVTAPVPQGEILLLKNAAKE